mgnify:FL=1
MGEQDKPVTVDWSRRATEFEASLTAPRQLRFPVLVKSPSSNRKSALRASSQACKDAP